jgi:ABC-2 type transport system ATP-binding protein
MALTATELVVIGRGRLIAQSTTAAFVDGASEPSVRVASPRLAELRGLLTGQGVTATPTGDGALVVIGADAARVGALAASAGLALTELSAHRGSLEEAFMHITGHDVEYAAGGPAGDPTTAAAPVAARR